MTESPASAAEAPAEEVRSGDAPKGRTVLEDFTRSFYDRKGVESWSTGIVPHFITCNAFIGRAYAKVLLGFIRDCSRPGAKMPLDPSEPLYVVELGAGSGKFSFFMLKALTEMADLVDFPMSKVVYVMTDFTEANFKFWNEHEGLKKYIDNGQLDLAIFDAVNDETITLHHSGKILSKNTCANPICVVANYLFDTLCHDVFQVDEGRLMEGLISVGSRAASEPDALDPAIIARLDNAFTYRPVDESYYDAENDQDAPHLRRILRWYTEFFGESPGGASVLVPIGAVRAMRNLVALSGGRAVVISGDKGNNNPEQFRGKLDPHIAVHGSFSVMVNYHALGLYCASRGGFALHNPQEEASLKVSVFVLLGDEASDAAPSAADAAVEASAAAPMAWTEACENAAAQRALKFAHLGHIFQDAVVRFGPNDFFVLQKSLKEDAQAPALKAVVALLKLSDWDPDVFYKFRDVILNQVPACGQKLRNDLCRNLPRVWANYFALDRAKDVAFEVGRFYYGIRDYQKALEFYHVSTVHIGAHHVTSHNIGLCHYSLGQLEQARDHFAQSLDLNINYEKAASWHDKVLREIEALSAPPDAPADAAAAAAAAADAAVDAAAVDAAAVDAAAVDAAAVDVVPEP